MLILCFLWSSDFSDEVQRSVFILSSSRGLLSHSTQSAQVEGFESPSLKCGGGGGLNEEPCEVGSSCSCSQHSSCCSPSAGTSLNRTGRLRAARRAFASTWGRTRLLPRLTPWITVNDASAQICVTPFPRCVSRGYDGGGGGLSEEEEKVSVLSTVWTSH